MDKRNQKEVIMYLIFGVLTTVVSIVSFAVIKAFMHPLLANVVSWLLAVAFAYVTNRLWVFAGAAHGAAAVIRECLSFFGGRVATLVMEELILMLGLSLLHLPEMPVKIAAQGLVIVGNYFISKLLVFKS